MASETTTELGTLLESRPGFKQGRPCLKGTGLTVHTIAAQWMSGLNAEEICAENPDLDRSLFYAALAYYFANKDRIEADLAEDVQLGEELMRQYPNGMSSDPSTL